MLTQIYNAESENRSMRSYYYWIGDNAGNEPVLLGRPDFLGKFMHRSSPYKSNQQLCTSVKGQDKLCKEKASRCLWVFFTCEVLNEWSTARMRIQHNIKATVWGPTHPFITSALCPQAAHSQESSLHGKQDLQSMQGLPSTTICPSTTIPICTAELTAM